MLRAFVLTTLVLASAAFVDQAQTTLHIKVVLLDPEQKPTAVPRHALLISDNPPTAAPRRILTRTDGTADVALRPGSYTVESDRPVAFNGKAYQWTAMVNVPIGGASLELTQDNAEVEAVTAASITTNPPVENDPSFLLTRWQDSVVSVWTATTRTSGFLVDARGVVATSQRAIGEVTSAEVQFSPVLKLAASVVATDPVRDIALLRIDPAAVKSVRPIAVDCAPAEAQLVDDQDILTIGAPLRAPKNLLSGRVRREGKRTLADLRLGADSSGGPVFTAASAVAGMTAMTVDPDDRLDEVRIVSAAEICEVLKSAESKLTEAPPSGVRLPVEPSSPFPAGALDNAVNQRSGVEIPYQMSSSDFDIAFITPVEVYAAGRRWKQAAGRDRRGTTREMNEGEERMRLLLEFGHWSGYFADVQPLLVVRVTPKLVEGAWMKIARGAAVTQGMALPPLKHLTSGFSSLRVLCGSDEVTPIHPFKLAHRINERDSSQTARPASVTYEGLYVFDPDLLGPRCGGVKLMLFSQKDPKTADTRAVDPKLLQLVWDDFAPYRESLPK